MAVLHGCKHENVVHTFALDADDIVEGAVDEDDNTVDRAVDKGHIPCTAADNTAGIVADTTGMDPA